MNWPIRLSSSGVQDSNVTRLAKRDIRPSLEAKEAVDLAVVPGDDHDQPVAVVLHSRRQRVHRLTAAGVTAGQAGLDEGVRLVGEQHTAMAESINLSPGRGTLVSRARENEMVQIGYLPPV